MKWNDEVEEKTYSSVGDIEEEILEWEEKEPKDRRKKDWRDWEAHLVALCSKYNSLANFKAYKTTK